MGSTSTPFSASRSWAGGPARIQLLHLREPLAISTVPSDQSIRGLRQQTLAVWAAVEQACAREDFRPRPGRLCDHCAYHAYCPAVGGDLSRLDGETTVPTLSGSVPVVAGGGSRPPVNTVRWRSPTVPIPEGVDRFDALVDEWFDAHLRGRPAVDRIMYSASALGDHGLIWLALAAVQAARRRERLAPPTPARRGRARDRIGAGQRPGQVDVPAHPAGPPGTTPPPAAPTSHQQLPERARHRGLLRGGPAPRRRPVGPLYYVIAVIVAASRIHVKIHYASDVIGGIAIGVGLGELTRHLVPVGARGARGARCP